MGKVEMSKKLGLIGEAKAMHCAKERETRIYDL